MQLSFGAELHQTKFMRLNPGSSAWSWFLVFGACGHAEPSVLLLTEAGNEAGAAGEPSPRGTAGKSSAEAPGVPGVGGTAGEHGAPGMGGESDQPNEAPPSAGFGGSGASSGVAGQGGSGTGGLMAGRSGEGGLPHAGGGAAGAGAGGLGGQGGAPASAGASSGAGGAAGNPAVRHDLIDDMEDGDRNILMRGGRQGQWYAFNDDTPSSEQVPAPGMPFAMAEIVPPREGSRRAVRMRGRGFTRWGAGVGCSLNRVNGAPLPYSIEAYSGLVFWARAGEESVEFRVQFPNVQTDPRGGRCAPGGCNDHFHVERTVDDEWTEIHVAFDELEQLGFARVGEMDPRVFAIDFLVPAGAESFVLFVDDVAFVE